MLASPLQVSELSRDDAPPMKSGHLFKCEGCKRKFHSVRRAPKFCSRAYLYAHHNVSRAGRPTREAALIEDAKWERVFQRLVDPDYYAPRIPSVGSSFGAFSSQVEMLCRW
jgi:hypothetical protein